MQAPVAESSAWDFTPVFSLLHSLGSQEGVNHAPGEANTSSSTPHPIPDSAEQIKPTLGNFNKLWDYLGFQPDSLPSAPIVHFESSSKPGEATGNDAYASDGAIYKSSAANERGWKSEGDHNPLELTDSFTDGPSAPALTKTQRKKHNRKLRAAAAKAAKTRPISDNEGDADADDDTPGPSSQRKSTRAAKLSKHAPKSPKKENKKPTTSATKQTPAAASLVPQATPKAIREAKDKVAAATTAAAASASGTQSDEPKPPKTPTRLASSSAKTIHESLKKQWPPAFGPDSTQYAFYTPTKRSGQPLAEREEETKTKRSEPPLSFPVIDTKPQARLRHEILPLVNQTSVERNWSLLLKLLNNFPEDRKYLVSPLQLSINRPQPNGIHVFVDASNILIGFYDHLKISRGIPKETRVPRVDLNFHALALLLERRRPVAKRVLAGSTPEIPAYEEARQVGYETCILDKVYKVKELTEKQKHIKSRELHATGPGYVSGSDSAGNGNKSSHDFPPQEAKWVEQAVDEILHLKILESVVDTPIRADAASPYAVLEKASNSKQAAKDLSTSSVPPTRPTIVLATGDAAEAEYSPGFRKMVERALKSGWMVEVMAFGRSVSRDYRRMAKTPLAKGGWGERFKIIELDSYAEELFGEEL